MKVTYGTSKDKAMTSLLYLADITLRGGIGLGKCIYGACYYFLYGTKRGEVKTISPNDIEQLRHDIRALTALLKARDFPQCKHIEINTRRQNIQ